MSTLVEALSVVIPRHVLDAGYPGGTEGYLDTARRARGARYAICDERLACVSFASPADADSFVGPLRTLGLGAEDGAPPPVACLDEDFGPTAACPWLRWRRHDDGFTSCWLEWTEPGDLATPTGWLPPRQRAAISRPGAPRPSAPPPAVVAPAVVGEPGAAPPPRTVSTAIGPLTPISSPAILAAMAASGPSNGRGPHDDDLSELDRLVAIAECPVLEADDDTADPMQAAEAEEAIGHRWALPEFEPTAVAMDVDDQADDDYTADDEVASLLDQRADIGDATTATEITDADPVTGLADAPGTVDMTDMDALIAVLPSGTETEPADVDADAGADATLDVESASDVVVGMSADSDAHDADRRDDGAYGAHASDDSVAAEPSVTPWEETYADPAMATAETAEEPDAASNDRDDESLPDESLADGSLADGSVPDGSLAPAVGGAATIEQDDDAAEGDLATTPAAGWSDVFDVALAAVSAIAEAADAGRAQITDDDVEALFEAGERYATAAPEPDQQPVATDPSAPVVAASLSAPFTASLTPAAMTAVATAAAPAPSLDAVRTHLAERGWRYSQDADQAALFYQTAGGRASYPGFAAADETAQLVWLYTQIPVRVPEHRRAAAVELLTRANHGLALGNFEFDYTDGEVRFKTVADTGDGCFSAAAAGRLLRHSLDACDRYHDALMQVIYGGLSPAEAVR